MATLLTLMPFAILINTVQPVLNTLYDTSHRSRPASPKVHKSISAPTQTMPSASQTVNSESLSVRKPTESNRSIDDSRESTLGEQAGVREPTKSSRSIVDSCTTRRRGRGRGVEVVKYIPLEKVCLIRSSA